MNDEPKAQTAGGFSEELRSCWGQLPDKTFFFVLLALWIALFQFFGNSRFGFYDTRSLLTWMYTLYTLNSPVADDGHGALMPFVVIGLFWWKRKELLSQPFRTWWPGLLVMGLALLLHVVGYVGQQQRISVVAFFTGIYGLMGLVWGPRWLRASFFPFFLFLYCVPLGSLTEPVTFPLRLMVSKTVAFICQHLLAIDVVSDGTRLVKMPWQYEYEVAAACSGMRSLVAISAIAIIYAFTIFNSKWSRLILVASAAPLAFIGNTVRMLAIVVTAEIGGQRAGMDVHDSWFWSLLPYIPAIGGLMALGRWLENREPAEKPVVATACAQPTIP